MLVLRRNYRAALASAALLFSFSQASFASTMALSAAIIPAAAAHSATAAETMNIDPAAPGADFGSSTFQIGDLAIGTWRSNPPGTFFSQDGFATAGSTDGLDSAGPSDTASYGGFALADDQSGPGDQPYPYNDLAAGAGEPNDESVSLAESGDGAAAGGRLLLLATATLGICMLAAVGTRSRSGEKQPPVPVRRPIAGRAWVQRGATFSMPPREKLEPKLAGRALTASAPVVLPMKPLLRSEMRADLFPAG